MTILETERLRLRPIRVDDAEFIIALLGVTRLAAIVNPHNAASIRVLEKLGMQHTGMIRLAENEPEIMLWIS